MAASTQYVLDVLGDMTLKSRSTTLKVDGDLQLIGSSSAANWRSAQGLVIDSDVQAYSTKLGDLAAVSGADSMVYYDGSQFQTTASQSFGRGLLDKANAAAVQTAVSLVPGTDVQAQDAALQDIADIVATSGQSLQYNGTNWVAYTPTDNARDAGNGLTLTGNDLEIDTAVTVDLDTAQTLTNKSLTAPSIADAVLVGQTNEVDGDDTKFSYVGLEAIQTTDATPDAVHTRALTDDSSIVVKGVLMAVTSAGDRNVWEMNFVVKRDTGAASTALASAGINLSALVEEDTGLSVAVNIDTTAGAYEVECTGKAATTVDWTFKMEEVVMA